MVMNIVCAFNDVQFDEKITNVFNTYNKYINYRFDYVIRTSINQIPLELNHDVDYSGFDPSQEILLACINSNDNENNVDKLRLELKNITAEVNKKRKEFNVLSLSEDGLKTNIKYLQEIIKIKEMYMQETITHTEMRCNAKEKVQKEYYKVTKKYDKIMQQLNSTSKIITSCGKFTEYGDRLKAKAVQYKAKIKRMDEVIKVASDTKEKLDQYQIALNTSIERLQIFYEQLKKTSKNKQEVTALLSEKNKRIKYLKENLLKLGVLSSIERSRVHTSSNLIEDDVNLKQEFLELQNMRNDVLSLRPKGMFNPKYHKKSDLTKEDIRKYLENDEAINSIDYLIELKNYEAYNIDTDILRHVHSNTEKSIFSKCLSTLSVDEVKKLLVHYFTKVVDLKETGRENDELIAKLDQITDRQKHTIVTLNNSYQAFHLSIEKKFASVKKYYQDKLNMLFQHLQEENNAIVMIRLRQELLYLRKKLVELEKELEKSKSAKPNQSLLMPETSRLSSEQLEASKSGSETVSSAKVTIHKNKIRIVKTRSKLA